MWCCKNNIRHHTRYMFYQWRVNRNPFHILNTKTFSYLPGRALEELPGPFKFFFIFWESAGLQVQRWRRRYFCFKLQTIQLYYSSMHTSAHKVSFYIRNQMSRYVRTFYQGPHDRAHIAITLQSPWKMALPWKMILSNPT